MTLEQVRVDPATLGEPKSEGGGQPGDPPQDPRSAGSSPCAAAGPSRTRIIVCSRCGRLTALSTCCTISRRRGRKTTVRVGRSISSGPGPRAKIHVVGGSLGGRPCERRGQRPAWGRTACRVRCRPGRGGGRCGGPRARRCGLRDRAVRAAAPEDERAAGRLECRWQRAQLATSPDLVLDDQRLRNELCWFAFDYRQRRSVAVELERQPLRARHRRQPDGLAAYSINVDDGMGSLGAKVTNRIFLSRSWAPRRMPAGSSIQTPYSKPRWTCSGSGQTIAKYRVRVPIGTS